MESPTPEQLKAFSFDSDSNLLFTSSLVHLLRKEKNDWKPVDVGQAFFDTLEMDPNEYRYPNDNFDEAMSDWREPGHYAKTFKEAVEQGNFAPSFPTFISATIKTEILAIITAAGQSMQEIKDSHLWLIMEFLQAPEREELVENIRKKTKDFRIPREKAIHHYLNDNIYLPVSSSDYFELLPHMNGQTIRLRKSVGFEHFVHHVQNKFATYHPHLARPHVPFSVGFSDDHPGNIQAMHEHINDNLLHKFPHTKFALYDTKEPDNIKKTVLQHKDSAI